MRLEAIDFRGHTTLRSSGLLSLTLLNARCGNYMNYDIWISWMWLIGSTQVSTPPTCTSQLLYQCTSDKSCTFNWPITINHDKPRLEYSVIYRACRPQGLSIQVYKHIEHIEALACSWRWHWLSNHKGSNLCKLSKCIKADGLKHLCGNISNKLMLAPTRNMQSAKSVDISKPTMRQECRLTMRGAPKNHRTTLERRHTCILISRP